MILIDILTCFYYFLQRPSFSTELKPSLLRNVKCVEMKSLTWLYKKVMKNASA